MNDTPLHSQSDGTRDGRNRGRSGKRQQPLTETDLRELLHDSGLNGLAGGDSFYLEHRGRNDELADIFEIVAERVREVAIAETRSTSRGERHIKPVIELVARLLGGS